MQLKVMLTRQAEPTHTVSHNASFSCQAANRCNGWKSQSTRGFASVKRRHLQEQIKPDKDIESYDSNLQVYKLQSC